VGKAASDHDNACVHRYAVTVTLAAISFLTMMLGSLLLDLLVRPRRSTPRRWQGSVLHGLAMTALFGLFLAGSGNALLAALMALALMALATVVSNAKNAMLGEPLLFSDFALIVWVVRHPRFYFTALSQAQRVALALAGPLLLIALAFTFVPRPAPHLVGAGLFAVAGGAAAWASRRWQHLAPAPDAAADVAQFGLVATLLLYWRRWRTTADPPAVPPDADAHTDRPELIIVVQCESFADPVALTGDPALALAGLSRARAAAWQWGNLLVSGFGAYTMRTEYGLLFGRNEQALGFRRYDPFLTALGEASHALPHRLRRHGYRSAFVHPHDMRFYGRERLMPAVGFAELMGEERMADLARGGRYLCDRALGAFVADLAERADGPALTYVVTMENHGPWTAAQGPQGALDDYLAHLRSSDAMLSILVDRLAALGRSALLVFFGDHRPSIPGVTQPGGDRHTPYVMLRFGADGQLVRGAGDPVDLSPAELHHAILRCVRPD
jgi:hypothetical protein